jgi:hypothetical protein
MNKETLADWLRDIAGHIEAESPLIRDIRVDDTRSDEGMVQKVITITFNAPGPPPPSDDAAHSLLH